MGRIRVLDDHLVNRIAAGEVVERPASVVKELVENALDAGAGGVDVAIDAGGSRHIRVADDGAGMDRDDALLALERHATSKLATAGDLDAIRTLGFRGEALPSIAAVSRFALRTSPEDGQGTEVEVRGGRIVSVRDVAMSRGTVVEVDRLFFNVPARRKFLRSEATELAHVVRAVTRFALARPDVRFALEHGGRVLLDAARAEGLRGRLRGVLGGTVVEGMVPFRLERDGVVVHGFAGRPSSASSRRDGVHLVVNGRVVQDRVLTHAVGEAYGNTVPRGHLPAVVVFVELEPAAVDVNVHPRKTEVRFRNSAAIHDVVVAAVRSALAVPGVYPRLADLRPAPPFPSEPRAAFEAAPWPRPLLEAAEPAGSVRSEAPASGARAFAQLHDSYILARHDDGLVIVDQHAAHERILFERFLAQADRNEVEIQRLAFPIVIELGPGDRVRVEEEAGEFRRLGFLVEPFGENAVKIDGVPALASGADPEALFRELLGEAGRVRSAAAGAPSLRHRLVTTAACKAAIKIHRPLGLPAMQALLDDLGDLSSPSTCPHGRPVLFRLTIAEIERAFRRR